MRVLHIGSNEAQVQMQCIKKSNSTPYRHALHSRELPTADPGSSPSSALVSIPTFSARVHLKLLHT